MLGDPLWDMLVIQILSGLVLYLGRKRIALSLIGLFLKVAPVEAIAQVAEKSMSAYIERKEVELGKGKVGVQYVATDRLKAILSVIAEPLMVEIMKKLQLRVKNAQEGGAVGGMDIGSLLGMFGGGGGKGKGGEVDMMKLLEMGMKFFQGGGGGQSQGGAPSGGIM